MIQERTQNIFFAIAIIVVMYFCFTGLAKQFDPDHVIPVKVSTYTQSSYEALEYKYIDTKKELNEIEKILGE